MASAVVINLWIKCNPRMFRYMYIFFFCYQYILVQFTSCSCITITLFDTRKIREKRWHDIVTRHCNSLVWTLFQNLRLIDKLLVTPSIDFEILTENSLVLCLHWIVTSMSFFNLSIFQKLLMTNFWGVLYHRGVNNFQI